MQDKSQATDTGKIFIKPYKTGDYCTFNRQVLTWFTLQLFCIHTIWD